jgi:apolipoprotein N-acyltransferase
VFVNFSNIGWFGNSIAIDQHLQISRLRALEFERPMLPGHQHRARRSSSTTAAASPIRCPGTREGVLVGEVEGRDGVTPYAWWAAARRPVAAVAAFRRGRGACAVAPASPLPPT